ncbi:PIN domain-containing protein [Ignisphaera sp. 4213-co]|uniref:PIN domain-containing protein n=1 Tax=Ignisphaera cupida TaxID=3050454 RepID=A0ABD4Z5E2_9CREN|nr:PIN domain-containing protein [Ignisphaera sp. 4213-co]MDK6028168.1 PIN domain-containing protein [Ignisphaera sp. 4213-co]
MGEERNIKAVIIDTYAILAMAYGELGEKAEEIMLRIRKGEITGYLPATVVYELYVHWLRGRIPVIKSKEELKTFVTRYFKVVELRLDDYIESAKIKVEGDKILKEVSELAGRSLSIVDSTLIWLAQKLHIPIVTGDKDLIYVAKKIGIVTIW